MRYSQMMTAAALLLANYALASPVETESYSSALRRDDAVLAKRASCGSGVGSCAEGQCCSEGGYCGVSEDYCKSPACQIDYSNGNCDSDKKPCGESTADIPRSNDGNAPYDKYITSCTEANTVALTFDDGPYLYTSSLLDLLVQYEAKATFFITGNNIGKGQIDNASTAWPSVIRRINEDGHQIGSHTWSHQDLSASDADRRETEMIYNEMALRNVLGFFPTYMRPPKGTCSRDSGCLDYVTGLGYHVVNWDVDTKDFENNTPDTIQTSKDLFDAGMATAGSHIVLSHDIQKETVDEFAEYMLKAFKAKGLKTVTVGECLGDPKENWYVEAAIESKCQIVDASPPGGVTNPVEGDGDLVVSKDGTCGTRSDDKYTCEGSTYGDCCSYNSWCGSTSAYCDGGCQSTFGSCNDSGDEPIVSSNGLCGGTSSQTCLGSSYGDCCSKYGHCGASADYCSPSKGCQSDWGTCEG